MSEKSAVNGSSSTLLTQKAHEEFPSGSNEIEKTSESKRRKLHKAYIKGWNEDIAKKGFARCIFASCSFISSDISIMQKHHKTCFGTLSKNETSDKNLAENKAQLYNTCKEEEKAMQKLQSSLNVTDECFKNWNHQIKTLGQAFCGNQECNFAGMNLSDLELHSRSCIGVPNFSLFCCIYCRCRYLTKEDHLKHKQNCSVKVSLGSNSKKVENLHFRVIKQMKNKDLSEDHIIQPGPDLPKGQYRRRRAYRAEHKNSWALTLEKFKYVKCIYQNCYFIAMSLEDMISHFGYCNGDGSFAKFICPYCNGRVTSEAILLKHIERSHPLENASIKDGSVIDESNNELLKSKSPESHIVEEKKLQFNKNPKMHEMSKTRQSACRKLWENQISEFGYAFCRKSLCNFMAPNIKELEVHLRTCDGTPDFELLNCRKCRYRLPKREDLTRHVPFCNNEKVKYFSTFGNEVTNSQSENLEEDDFEIGPVFRQYQGKRQKQYTKKHKLNSSTPEQAEDNLNESKTEEKANENVNSEDMNLKDLKQKARGRSKKSTEIVEKNQQEQVKCGKCDFQGTKNTFVYHNMKTHVGLGWVEGEQPVDLDDEKLVIRLVKEAFRLNKKAACEKCDDVKRSVMGFVTHIQSCGKSEEEKNALKIQCPYCEGKYLKYSLSSHIKLCNPSPEEEEEDEEEGEEEKEKEKEKSEALEVGTDTSGKRRSAIKAVSKFQEVLNENDEAELSQETHYILYERGNERIPKLNSKLNNLWYKLKREKKKIPCRHVNCKTLSSDVREAKNHHYNCPLLPEKVYMCEVCDFYSIEESEVKSHVTTHRKYLRQRKVRGEEEVKPDEDFFKNEEDDDEEDDGDEEEEEEEEEEEDDDDDDDDDDDLKSSEEEMPDSDESRKRKKKRDSGDRIRKKTKFSVEAVKTDLDIEFRLKQKFCKRVKIDNVRGIQFYSNGLDMTLQEEVSALERSETWTELHTSLEDWLQVPPAQTLRYFPELAKSVSIRFGGNENKWQRFERFNGDLIDGVPVMFTGGSVRSMSWCKISFKRMMEKSQRQYLAVTTARKLDYLKDIYDRSSIEKSTLLQIWDCGTLDNDVAKDIPKFALGMVQKGGEIWDLAWFPNDTYAEDTEKRMRRLGLLATASEDGIVRIWSVCDPSQLGSSKGHPIYVTDPVVMLTADKDVEESCFKLTVGSDGVLAGGFSNGTVAVWDLKNISSPFCKKSGKCKVIRAHLVFQPHKTAITALTFCPLNSRYISTAALDRFVKVWDLESTSVPVEQYNKDYSLDNIWTMNWPSLIYNFDDVVINFNKGAVKFIKDILTDRHQSTFAMEDTCLSLSFSDWLNAVCGGSITGEVKLRLLKNLIHDQKRFQSTISSLRLEKLNKDGKKEDKGNVAVDKAFPRSYDDADLKFGLVFKDNLGMDKGKPKKSEAHPEEFPIRAVNKVAFNPNFKSFTHVALGYNCGLIRIHLLKELQSAKSLKFFLEKTQREKL